MEKAPHWVKAYRRISRVDPFLLFNWTVSPVPGYFSAEWDGKINIDEAGTYVFHTQNADFSLTNRFQRQVQPLDVVDDRVGRLINRFTPKVVLSRSRGQLEISGGI